MTAGDPDDGVAMAIDAFRTALAISRAVARKDLQGPTGVGALFNAAPRKDLVVWALAYNSLRLAERVANACGAVGLDLEQFLETAVYEAAVFDFIPPDLGGP